MLQSLSMNAPELPRVEAPLNFQPGLNLITGPEGSGKTRALDFAYFALTGDWPAVPFATLFALHDGDYAFSAKITGADRRTVLRKFVRQQWSWSNKPVRYKGTVLYVSRDHVALYDPIKANAYRWRDQRPTGELRPSSRYGSEGGSILMHDLIFWSGRQIWSKSDDLRFKPFQGFNRLSHFWICPDYARSRATFDAFASSFYGQPVRLTRPTRLDLNDVEDYGTVLLDEGPAQVLRLASRDLRAAAKLACLLTWLREERALVVQGAGRDKRAEIVVMLDEDALPARLLDSLAGVCAMIEEQLEMTCQLIVAKRYDENASGNRIKLSADRKKASLKGRRECMAGKAEETEFEKRSSFGHKTVEALVEHLVEHAARVAGGHNDESSFDPETLSLESDASRELMRLHQENMELRRRLGEGA